MDPYYQQQQQQANPSAGQQQMQSAGQQIAGSRNGDGLMGAPSAPSMQAGAPQQHGGVAHGSGGHRSYSGQHQHQHQHQSHHQHQQAQQQQQAYLDYGGGSVSGPQPGHTQRAQSGGGGYHHGGQPPLPPGAHHSSGSGRYGGQQRSAVMHQHRSSAAAISEPMMASTITEQLANASGPLSGSGSALDQLGLSSSAYLNQQPYYARDTFPGADGMNYPQAGNAQLQAHSGARYADGHYPTRVRHLQAQYGSSAPTTTGAYHLERNEAALAAEMALRSGSDPRGYPMQGVSRYSSQPLDGQSGYSFGASDGLGAYNPLEDPLAHSAAQLHLSGPNFGPNPHGGSGGGGASAQLTELRARLQEAQGGYARVKRELETATQKLGSSMHSIKSFWSPELKKERALRKEEATKYALINDQMKLMRVEVQKQALLIRQLEDELRLAHETRFRNSDPDIQQHIDSLCMEKESLSKENCYLRETVRELEMRIETQKQTLAARDDSIKKMVEMMNNKGIATKIMEDERIEMDRVKTRNIELEARLRHYETMIENKEKDIIKTNPKQEATNSNDGAITRPQSPQIVGQKPRQPRLARAQRLKNRLSGRKDSSLSSSSQSSGFSSSRSLDSNCPKPENSELRSEEYKLCECQDCRASGQQIFSWAPATRTAPRPTVRKAVSFRSCVEQIGSPSYRQLTGDTADESCDNISMLVSKDLSLLEDNVAMRACSTPNQSGQRLVRAEVHEPPVGMSADYTCLCSADFVCVHNYPHLRLQLQQQPTISNEIYGSFNSGAVNNSRGCEDLSTYVNLSQAQQHVDTCNNSYAQNEYAQQIKSKSKQTQVYAANYNQNLPAEQLNNYISVARRFQQTIDDCDMCKEQLRQSNMALNQCSCPPEQSSIVKKKAEDSKLDVSNVSSVKSFHTASSSMHQLDRSPSTMAAMINASELSVLPVGQTLGAASSSSPIAQLATTKDEDKRQQSLSDPNNVDSSLSSLFAYRHASDDNQHEVNENEFDPDSLELNNKSTNVDTKSANQKLGSWLKARPKSDYISLSSTTSANKAQLSARGAKLNNEANDTNQAIINKPLNPRSHSSGQLMQDLSQSSLAKRRHLSNSLQQQQQSSKRKLLGSKCKSSSNINVSASSVQQTGHNRSNSSARTIYQCVKNHLLDITKSSQSSQNSSNSKSSSSSTLPRDFNPGAKKRLGKSAQMEELRSELTKRDQEMLTMNAKMKALEDQQRDSQRHIRLLKDSLVAKEEHYNLLLADVEELRRNLDERNKLIDKKSFQQTSSLRINDGRNPLKSMGNQFATSYQELNEMQALLELRDKKINELQRKVVQLDGLLSERDSQIDRTRMRLDHSSSNHPDMGLLNHLEEALGDKEKQISLLRDQRDRAEHELNEERDSHERSIKEYKMKLNSLKFELDKVQNRLSKTNTLDSKFNDYSSGSTTDRFGGSSADQSAVIKRLELDKRSLQLECDRLKDKLDSNLTSNRSRQVGSSIERASSALGGDFSIVEFERLQEALDAQKQELRRAQAESRMNEMERKRAQEEADKLSERYERIQGELHKFKAKLENATSEREQLLEEYERQQQLINKAQTERDCALADINQLKLDNERQLQNFNKNQLQAEKLQAQSERTQIEYKKLEDRYNEASDELRRIQSDKSGTQRELSRLEMELQSSQMQLQRFQQEKELNRNELDKLRDKLERLEAESERYLHDKELNQQQVTMYKERIESHQQQVSKLSKEREQLSMEIHELRERLHKQQKLQDTSELETRNEVRVWKEKYERSMAQLDKLNQDLLAKQKESQMVMEKLQRVQNDVVKLESKLEQSEMDRERMSIEVEKCQQVNSKAKDDFKKWQDESAQLQEMYTKTSTKLLKLSEVEEKLRIDYDKCQMDLEVLRERYEKLQLESRKLQSERDRLQVEHERIKFDNERIQQSQGISQSSQDDFIRISSELERSVGKLEQYQREINKLQLEKERLVLDSKSAIQQTEQQYQQQFLKFKSNEEKLAMENERIKLQFEKVQSKYELINVDQEKLISDKERLQQQLQLLQQEVDKFRNQQSSSVQETKKLHDDEMQRVLQELETIREKYSQQRKELLQLRELQQNHELDKDILERKLQAAELRLEKLNQTDSKQKQDSDRCLIEIEKLKDKIERKQQELVRAQKERNQFAQEITVLHQQIQQLSLQFEQQQQKQQSQGQQSQAQQTQVAQNQSAQQQQPQVRAEEINKLKQMLVKSETDLQKTMAENQRFQMEVERLKLQLDDAAEYIGKIESDNALIQKQNQEIIQQLKQQSAVSGSQQQVASQQKQQQQDEQDQQQELRKMQDVIKKSANEINKMVEERSKLQEMNKELQRSMEQTKVEFANTMDQYEAELQRLHQEAQQQRQQQQQQQGSNQQQQKQQPAAPDNEYKVRFEKAVEAIKAFQKTSDDMKKEIIKLNERNKSLSDQNQNLIQSIQASEQALKKQQKADKATDGSVASSELEQELKQQLAHFAELCSNMEKDLNKSHQETQQHQQANQQLKQTLEKSQLEFANLKTERDRYQTQLEKLMIELKRREDETANLQSQQEKSGQNLQAKQNELAAYQKQLDEREKALETKRNELQNLSKQLQQQPTQSGNQQQQETIIKLQQQIKALEEENAKLRGELERVRNELKQSQAEPERLLKILSASEMDKFNLTQQIEQLQEKLKRVPVAPGSSSGGGQQQQQARGPPPPPAQGQQQQVAANKQQPQQVAQRAGQAAQQQQQQRPQQQQQKQTGQNQRPSGAGGFISGLFQ